MSENDSASPLISIVVPVYKTEKYLKACVESVLTQTFTDFELILVDDGSPDKCGEICDELAKKDPRIKVFHQKNGGVTSARRLGVEQARGEWICFLDADDLLPPNALKDLFDEADDDTDWVQGMGLRFNDGETPVVEMRTGKVTIFDLTGLAENMLLHHPAPWGKLVRKKLFSPHTMGTPRDIKVGQDAHMNIRLIVNNPRGPKEIDKVVYFYRLQGGSTCHTCVRTENYTLRHAKLLFAEVRKISTPSNKKRLSFATSRFLCGSVAWNIGYGLPIKFPHRLAAIMHPAAKSKPEFFFVYLCLKFNCLGIARILSKIYSFLSGQKLDVKTKTIVD